MLQHPCSSLRSGIACCVRSVAYASILPLSVGTIAMFDVIAPSTAFSLETTGWPPPSVHKVRNPK